MKTAKTLMAASALGRGLGAAGAASAATDDGAIVKEELIPGNYCHMKFPAIAPGTLGSDHPALQTSASGDSIDFYGPCDESPTGRDQQRAQEEDDFLSRQRD